MDSIGRQVAVALGFGLAFIIFVLVYAVRHDVLDHIFEKYTDLSTPLNHTAPKSHWDPSRQYLMYLPFEGISNQFYSFQNAAILARRLNRTLVVPPITSNRHDRLGTNQPWSNYMDLEHMSIHSGVQLVEWYTIKYVDPASRQMIETGSRTNLPKLWKDQAERLPCQVIRNYGHDYFVGEEDSIGADFAYQFLLDLELVPVPGFALGEPVDFVGDIVDHNQNSTDHIICLTFTFTPQFQRGHNGRGPGWKEAGQYVRFLPRFASYVEDLIAFRFGELESHIHPRPPVDLGTSILDKGPLAETFLSRKPPYKDYIAIHLRRGDIETKCKGMNSTASDCITPLSEYKQHVDGIVASLPEHTERPNVVLVSDTDSEAEKREIDSYGWYRLDHAVDPNLLEASKVLGPFSPALIDSAVLTGRSARWVIGSRRSTMSWLAAMRISTWNNRTIIYPSPRMEESPDLQQNKAPAPSAADREPALGDADEQRRAKKYNRPRVIAPQAGKRLMTDVDEESGDGIVTWDRHERQFFDRLAFTS
ncbi:hypothetical protein EDD21DRAFT_110992 [Dissophora ornata]|nr:hypothetical protein EDD21DRAFT_110992 [Dissophora ornata]